MDKRFWITNVLLEDGFIYENGEVSSTKTSNYNLLVENGKIVELRTGAVPEDGTLVKDAKGLLALPAFADKHIHLDKGHFGGPWKASTIFKGVADRIREEEQFLPKFLSVTKERAEKLLNLILSSGAVHFRVHGNVDPVIGHGNMERVLEVLEENKDRLTYEFAAFPQHGLLRSNSIQLMKEAMRKGASIVGGLDPATIDNDIEASLNKMIEIAVEFNSDIDIHLHDRGSLGLYTIKRLAKLVEEAKWQGRVNISHAYCMGDITTSEVLELAELLSSLNISIATTSPIDLAGPPIPLLYEKGVKVYLVNDNINDHWSPFGTGDILHKASRMAEKFNWIDEYSLTRALGFITEGKTPLDSEGNMCWPRVGDDANIVFAEASCSAEAVARRVERNAVMFKGKIVSGEL